MPFRVGLGPVFGIECLAAPRRWQVYVGRVVFVAMLLLGLWMIWAPEGAVFYNLNDLARVGASFFRVLVGAQLAVVMLVAPAATAGSICVDKSRGTLMHVFVTDLTAREIVLGKLAGRLLTVFSLMACSLPVAALSGLLGGVDYAQIARAYLATAAIAVFACSLALTFSVWARRPPQALIPTFSVLATWATAYPIASGLIGSWSVYGLDLIEAMKLVDPLWATFRPGAFVIRPWAHSAGFVAGSLAVSAFLVAVSVTQLRRVAIGDATRAATRARADSPIRLIDFLPGPSLDGNPVLWREWHRKRPSKWTGRFWTLYAAMSLLAGGFVLFAFMMNPTGIGPLQLASTVNGALVSVGLLLLTVSATTSLAEERDRGSLDVVLATPLETAAILWGKWWGTFAIVPRLAVVPFWIGLGMAMVGGRWLPALALLALILAYSALITSLGLALATWIPRLGRAVGTGLALLILINAGLYLLRNLWGRNGFSYDYYFIWLYGQSFKSLSENLDLGIPFEGIAAATRWCGDLSALNQTPWTRFMAPARDEPRYVGVIAWVLVYAGAALWLMLATIASFDRLLQRMTTDVRLDAPPSGDPSARMPSETAGGTFRVRRRSRPP